MSVFPETPCTLLVKLAAQMTGRSDEFAWQRFFELYQPAIVKFGENQGAAADAIHFEGMAIFQRAIDAFLTGDMKGVNIVLPIVGGDFDEMMQQFVLPFEAAGYDVRVAFCPAKEKTASSAA